MAEQPELAIVAKLKRKLHRREIWHEPDGTMVVPCDADDEGAEAYNANPDGPEAAAIIKELVEALKRAELDLNHLGMKYGEEEFVAPTICRIRAALSRTGANNDQSK